MQMPIVLYNLSFGFICPLDLRESPRRAEIAMGFILKNMDPTAILSIRGFDAVQRADKPKTQVYKVNFKTGSKGRRQWQRGDDAGVFRDREKGVGGGSRTQRAFGS